MPIDGRSWAIAEVPTQSPLATPPVQAGGMAVPTRADPPSVVTQHGQPDRKFVIINSQASYVSRSRPAQGDRRGTKSIVVLDEC